MDPLHMMTHSSPKYYTVWGDFSLTTNFSGVNGGSSSQIRRSDLPLISGGVPAHGTSAVVSQPQGMIGAVLPIWPGYLQSWGRRTVGHYHTQSLFLSALTYLYMHRYILLCLSKARKRDGWLPYHLECEVPTPRLHRVKVYCYKNGYSIHNYSTYIPLVLLLYFLLYGLYIISQGKYFVTHFLTLYPESCGEDHMGPGSEHCVLSFCHMWQSVCGSSYYTSMLCTIFEEPLVWKWIVICFSSWEVHAS